MNNTKIMYFSAAWCPPCNMMKPMIAELINDGFNIDKIDVDENGELAGKFQIRSIPTMVHVDSEGKELKRLVGVQSAQVIKDLLNN